MKQVTDGRVNPALVNWVLPCPEAATSLAWSPFPLPLSLTENLVGPRPSRLIAGKWVDGLLLEWRRGADNRWKGVVNYQGEACRKVAIKDQSQLRPDTGT
jgi:hypothetical protein